MFEPLAEFVRSLYPQEDFVPLHAPRFKGQEKAYLNACVDSTFVSSVGAYVDAFEQQLVAYTGLKFAVATVNGTSALHIALRLVGVEVNTQVITQSLSFVATCNAIAYCQAEPLFVDVSRETLGLCPEALGDFLETQCEVREGVCWNRMRNQRVSACVPMHSLGHPCQMDAIASICLAWGIPLVEDAAESLGSFYQGQHTGQFGRVAAMSFNGNKIVTAGGGGAILTNDEALARHAKHLTTTAKKPHPWRFEHDEVGYNYRMPNLNAALLCAQLEQLPNFVENKRQTAEAYAHFCAQQPFEFVREPEQARSNYWLNAILLEDGLQQEACLSFMNEQKIMTRPLWTPMHQLPMFAACQTMPLPNTQFLAERVVNLPSSVRL